VAAARRARAQGAAERRLGARAAHRDRHRAPQFRAKGLAIGAAFALGEAALGTLLIVGFHAAQHDGGLAILAPIAKERPSIGLLIKLGLIGGVPTIAGAWLGGFVYSQVAAVLCLGLGAGAIALGDHPAVAAGGDGSTGGAALRDRAGHARAHGGFAVMYATGMLVG
jgi:hypothetical protein